MFNGEIYNFRLLREELKRDGHRFRSATDSEVLLHLYEADGLAMLSRLNGYSRSRFMTIGRASYVRVQGGRIHLKQ